MLLPRTRPSVFPPPAGLIPYRSPNRPKPANSVQKHLLFAVIRANSGNSWPLLIVFAPSLLRHSFACWRAALLAKSSSLDGRAPSAQPSQANPTALPPHHSRLLLKSCQSCHPCQKSLLFPAASGVSRASCPRSNHWSPKATPPLMLLPSPCQDRQAR